MLRRIAFNPGHGFVAVSRVGTGLCACPFRSYAKNGRAQRPAPTAVLFVVERQRTWTLGVPCWILDIRFCCFDSLCSLCDHHGDKAVVGCWLLVVGSNPATAPLWTPWLRARQKTDYDYEHRSLHSLSTSTTHGSRREPSAATKGLHNLPALGKTESVSMRMAPR